MRYRVLKSILLGFIRPSGQVDVIFGPDRVIELDSGTIYLIDVQGERRPSITTENAIEVWLETEQIEEYHGEFVVG